LLRDKDKHRIESEHLHKNLKATADLETSHSGSNRLEIPESGVEKMETRKVNVFHFIQVNHALINLLIPRHPRLLLLV
jgi:hypothetical protein